MSIFKKRLERPLKDALPVPGLYHYPIEGQGEKSRVHLRLDPDGHGTLIVNANRILYLNPTAALMTWMILENKDRVESVRLLQRHYHVNRKQAGSDLQQIETQVRELVRPNGACPVHDLELDTIRPFSARPSAPYRMDLALTYRCNNDCTHCYNISGRNPKELSTGEWKRILDRTWDLGIPHIIFTGGEPTLRDDLAELIVHAEKNGQITGLNTNARRLADPGYVEKLTAAGLDHVQITLESCDPQIHDRMVQAPGAFRQTVKGLENVLATPLYVMTNTTMLRSNASTIPATLDYLAELGVPAIGLNALIHSGRGATVGSGLPEEDLYPLLETARNKTERGDQRLIWYTPTQYCHFDPTQLELGIKGCTAALYNMCIEPDGSVIPCQSYYQPLGNILHDGWDSIWNHELALRLRERRKLPDKCAGCALIHECGGGCPLQFESIL